MEKDVIEQFKLMVELVENLDDRLKNQMEMLSNLNNRLIAIEKTFDYVKLEKHE